MKRKEKYLCFSSPEAKRAEIEEMLAEAQKLTDAGYGYIRITREDGETGEEVEIIKNENI